MPRRKKHKNPRTIIAAINNAARQEEFLLHGKAIAFKKTLQRSKKEYNRKYKLEDYD